MSQSDTKQYSAPLLNTAYEDYNSVNAPDFDEACLFLKQLALAAYSYGSGAGRLQSFLSTFIESLGFSGVFDLTPTAIVLALRESADQPQRVELLGYPAVSMDMSKLAATEKLVLSVAAKETPIGEALSQLDAISRRPHRWSRVEILASCPAVAVGVAATFGGCWWDVLWGGLLSIIVGTLAMTCTGLLLPFAASMVAALVATAIKIAIPAVDTYLVTLSAVMTLLPGLSISVGTAELTSETHMLAGLVTVTHSMLYLVNIGAGAWFGETVVRLLVQVPTADEVQSLDLLWTWILFAFEIWGLCACTLMDRHDIPWAALNFLVGYFGSMAGTALKDKNFGAFVGGTLVFMFGNFWSNKTQRPASIVVVPILYFMVAAVSAFHGIAQMAQGEIESGKRDFLQMFVTALMLEAGFIAGNAIVPLMKIAL